MRSISKGLAFGGLFVFALSAYPQDRDRDRDERFYGGRLFEHVRADLDRLEDGTIPFTGDRRRVARVKEELSELQSKLDSGRYDPAELGDVIQAMDAVLHDNRLSDRERDLLSDDLARLREFNERRADGIQDRDRDRDGDRFYGGRLFEHVRTDLDRVQDSTFPFTGDRRRVVRVKEELNELQGKLASGQYDPRELSDVIEATQVVVNDNHLAPHDRDILSDDLARMREFRERHSEWR